MVSTCGNILHEKETNSQHFLLVKLLSGELTLLITFVVLIGMDELWYQDSTRVRLWPIPHLFIAGPSYLGMRPINGSLPHGIKDAMANFNER